MAASESARQTRLESLLEAIINVLIGFAINYLANVFVLRHFGFDVDLGTAFYISVVFTAISIARGYMIRRWAEVHLRRAG